MASAHTVVHSLLFLVLKTHLSLAATTKGSSPHRIVTRLIHRDSLLSPYYNPNDTIPDRAARILQSSTARLVYFESKVLETNVHQLNLVPSFPELFVNFSLGDPPIRQLAVMDTGSNLLWVRCAPCRNCRGQNTPVLDPLRSSTYSSVSCRTSYCSYAPRSKCDRSNWCIYNQTYYDGPSSRGVLSKDQLTFETWDDGAITVPDVVFGCGHDNGRFRDGRITGILGLGARMISLVSRLGSKFSYCIGNLMDPSYAYNHLILGEGAIFEGYSTPLEVVEGLYYVTLEGISIGQKRLDINRNAFRRTRRYDGVVIDSGSPMTWLVEGAAQAVHSEVKSLLDGVLEQVSNGASSPLCYRGTVGRDLIGFPVMTLHFADGADLGLDAASMFYQARDNMFCVAVVRSDVEGLSIVGLMAQQYYNMAFDVAGKKLSFQRIDCALLDE
ncbi:aspartic proteinase CDR1-like [Rhodamnia argentea]|uniref:Aspartic proteinase CDR1-like n=1 Tax=Rhodamnia argentea TaxID=178133 RepID=A0A8B8MXW5_9MYRT|nr:aspartic proteinase CDR1-like [Rhodamnia argentea]